MILSVSYGKDQDNIVAFFTYANIIGDETESWGFKVTGVSAHSARLKVVEKPSFSVIPSTLLNKGTMDMALKTSWLSPIKERWVIRELYDKAAYLLKHVQKGNGEEPRILLDRWYQQKMRECD